MTVTFAVKVTHQPLTRLLSQREQAGLLSPWQAAATCRSRGEVAGDGNVGEHDRGDDAPMEQAA